MIAITFALPAESSDFRKLLRAQNHEVAILHTGVGATVCRERLEVFLEKQRFQFLISSGFAGGVAPSLGVGDIFLGENYSDADLLARARELLVAEAGRLATADRVISSERERQAFARAHAAEAVDMETATIAEICAARSLPLLSLRVISDTAAAPFPAPPEVLFDLARQKTDAGKLGSYLLRHPTRLLRLMRFSRQIRTARGSLTGALTVLVRELRA